MKTGRPMMRNPNCIPTQFVMSSARLLMAVESVRSEFDGGNH